MKNIVQRIEHRAKQLGISQRKLAASIGLTQPGLQRALKVSESLKVKDLLKIATALEMKMEDLFSENEIVGSSAFEFQIENESLKMIPEVLKYIGSSLDEFCFYTGLRPVLEFNKIESLITYDKLRSFCNQKKFPFELFLKNEFRHSLFDININDFLRHNSLIKNSQLTINYCSRIQKITCEIVDFVNDNFVKDERYSLLNDYSYFNKIVRGQFISNHFMQIFHQTTNKPLIIISDFNRTYYRVQHAVEGLLIDILKDIPELPSDNLYFKNYIIATITFSEDLKDQTDFVKYNEAELRSVEWVQFRGNIWGGKSATKEQLLSFFNYLT